MIIVKLTNGIHDKTFIKNIIKDDIDNIKCIFTDWINSTHVGKFILVCTTYPYTIEFSTSRSIDNNTCNYKMVCTVDLPTLVFNEVYILSNAITTVSIDDMSDIISFLLKVSIGDIVHCKDQGIINLVNMQMNRVINNN